MKKNNSISRLFGLIQKNKTRAKYSFQFQLILSFLLVSILPLLLIQTISAYITTESMRTNIDETISTGLLQTRKSLDLTISSYEDFLFQMYTDDDIVEKVNNINNNHDVAVNINQLRRSLRSFSNAKPSVQSITILTANGKMIAYDKLTAVTFESSWLKDAQAVYKKIVSSNNTIFMETGNTTQFNVNSYYLFHLAHRIVDYKHIFSDVGVIVISMDESVLAEACNETPITQNRTSLNFIINDEGKLISFPARGQINEVVDPNDESLQQLITKSKALAGNQIAIHRIKDEATGWTIVNATDQTDLTEKLRNQQQLTVLVGILATIVLILIILPLTRRLSGSITRVVKAMNKAGTGELSVRIDSASPMPLEIQKIADQFNSMMQKIGVLIEEVKSATFKQKEAEIRALESQINPHFLYNTLDTINWMALDKDEHEISTMINSLAKILRYGVDNSNAIVTLREEIDWLYKYIYLQQTRLKSAFTFKTDIDQSTLDCKVHKLLLQPFVENAILHGFYGKKDKCVLTISIKDQPDCIEINIEDNGIGMSSEMVETINRRELRDAHSDHIGIENVQSRLEMYYGDKANLHVQSNENGTQIILQIAKL